MRAQRYVVVFVAALAVLSGTVGGVGGDRVSADAEHAAIHDAAVSATAQSESNANATVIDDCMVITEPGRYVLADDIEASRVITVETERTTLTGCIVVVEVFRGPVVIEGVGHTISPGSELSRSGAGGAIRAIDTDLTVRNVTVTGFGFGVGSDDFARVEGVTATDNGVGLFFGDGGIVRDSTITDNGFGISFRSARSAPDAVVVGSVIEDNRGGGISAQASFGVSSLAFRLEDSVVRDNGGVGVDTDVEVDVRIADSVIDDNDGDGVRTSGDGSITRSRITDNEGSGVFIDHNASVGIHHNSIAGNGVGVNNTDSPRFIDVPEAPQPPDGPAQTDATCNYWGADNGPSSVDDPDAPFADPVTGALADGDGDAVSEGEASGISNVHFDPFLTEPPTDASDGEDDEDGKSD